MTAKKEAIRQQKERDSAAAAAEMEVKLTDITAGFLTEVCHNVGTEPQLQPLSGEQLTLQSANKEDGAHLDIAADDFWGGDRNRAFFDVRVFSPFAQSHRNTSLSQCYMKNERDKRRAYDQRIREVEHGSFSPLVFFHSRRNGTNSQCSLQENCINAVTEV